MDRLRPILEELAKRLEKKRTLLLVLSSLVIFVTTYMLILPAFTLDRDKAVRQGGISVPSVVRTSAEDTDAENTDAAADADSSNIASEVAQNADSKDKADSASGSDNSSDASKSDTESSSAARSAANSVLTYDGKGYTVTIEDKNQSLPADAEISAEEITSDTDKKQYDKLSEAVTEAMTDAGIIASEDTSAAGKSSDDAGKKADDELQWIHFYDVKAISDGSDLTDTGKFLVNIDYDDQDREQVSADETDNVRIVRLEENEMTGDIDAEILDEKDDKIDLTTESGELVSAEFQANGPAVYAVMLVNTDNNEDSEAGNNNDSNDNDNNADSGLRELDLGTAVVSAADGSELPEDADGHAAIVDGAKAIKSVEKKYTDLADDTQYEVFDIALDNVDEAEYKDGFKVEVNLPENIQGKNFRLFHIHDGKVEELDLNTTGESISKDGAEEITGFTFETEGFSQFVLAYTVDFEYEADGQTYQYSLPGGEKIRLSELVEILGIINNTTYETTDDFLKAVDNVEFSDPELVKVNKNGLFGLGSDWVLKSLKAFDTEKTLTITMSDGQTIEVRVTDAQDGYTDMKSASQSLNFSLVDNGSETANYNQSTQRFDMKVNVEFQIPDDTIKGGTTKFDLELSSDVKIPDEFLNREYSGYDSVTGAESYKYKLVKDDSGKYHMLVEFTDKYVSEMKSSGRTIGKNSLKLDVSVGSDKLQDDGSLKYDIIDNKDIIVTPEKIHYPDGTDGQHDINVTKSFGGYDKASKKMKYTLVVTSKQGTAGPIIVEDTLSVLSGSNIIVSNLAVTSVKTGNGNENWFEQVTTPVTDYTATPSEDKTGLTITLPKAVPVENQSDKVVYLVEYEYTLDIVGDDFESSGKNSVTATSDKIKSTGEAYWNISQSGIALNKNGQYNSADGKITWTITVTNNKDDSIPLQDDAFKDIDFDKLTITPGGLTTDDYDKSTGTLTIPKGSSYTITYTTTPTSADPTKPSKVKNVATAGNGEGSKTADPEITVPAEASIAKELVTASRSQDGNTAVLTWRVRLHVPAGGFAEGTTLTDSVVFNQNWVPVEDGAQFTDNQRTALENSLKSYFDDAIEKDTENSTTSTVAMKFTKNWPAAGQNSDILGKDITIEYQTTADLSKLSSDNNGYDNTFKINDLSATATHSFKDRVVKLSNPGNAADVTIATADKDNNRLHWYIQVALEQDAKSITVNDTLPDGLKVTSIKMGDGFYNLVGLVQTSEGQWAGETETDWRNGQPAWNTTYMSDSTPSATVNGKTVTISLSSDNVPDYFKANDVFYFFIEAEIDQDQFPATGSTEVEFKNTAEVKVDGTKYGEDDQTQKVTLKTDIIDKTGDSSVWNAENGAHELSYAVDINPTGGQIAGEDGKITLTDRIEYYKTVKDNKGDSHKVSLNLKEGSTKLQRKDSNGQWVDIPATEGWGFVLNENATSSNDNVKVKEIQVYGIPDETVLRFVYTYNVVVEGLAKNATVNLGAIKNTATLKAAVEESDSHTESKDWKNVSSDATTESSGSMTIVKVQEGNYAITLPDTYFGLEVFVPKDGAADSEGSWQPINAVGSSIEGSGEFAGKKVYKTNGNGKLIISEDPANLGNEGSFEYDKLYRVREYEPKDGYTLDGLNPTAVYFYFGKEVKPENVETALKGYNFDGGSTHADDLLREADTVYMTNRRVTDTITAGKQWNSSTLWPNDIIQITLELQDQKGNKITPPSSYKENADGKYYTDDGKEWQNPVVLTKNKQQAMWEKLDINTASSDPFADYRVVETEIKYAETATSAGVSLDRKPLGNDQYQWVNKAGEVLYETFGGKVTGGGATIVNVNKTKLDVVKSWGTQNLGSKDIKVIMSLTSEERLYAKNGVIENPLPNWTNNYSLVEDISPIELDGTTDTVEKEQWKATFSNLDKFRYDESTGQLYEIRYSVQEKVDENGKDITDRYLANITFDNDHDTVTVTNSSNVGKLLVHKTWQRRELQDGETQLPALPDTVYINIERYYTDDSGAKHNDATFNADHKGIAIKESDTYRKSTPNTLTWAKLFENLERQVDIDGKKYDYHYEVKEDTLSGFTAKYDFISDNGTLYDGETNQTAEMTITNVEKEERHEEKDINIQLKKFFADGSGNIVDKIPDGASATFRLYRYVTTERGSYDAATKTTTKDKSTSEAKTEDTEFNDEDNDSKYSLTYPDKGTKRNEGGNEYVELNWEKLPIEETYYRDDTYTKYTYEYYLVETASSNSTDKEISYIATFLPANGKENGEIYGSASSPITEDSYGTETLGFLGEKEITKIAQVKNIESKKTFTVRKYWPSLDASMMPGIVFQLQRSTDMNFGTYETVSVYGFSDNGSSVDGASTFTVDGSGNTIQGYLLNGDNGWNISFNGLEEKSSNGSKYYYRAIEVGYYTKTKNNQYVVMRFDSNQFETRYNYTSDLNYVINLSGKNKDSLRDIFKENLDWKTINNYGTYSIANIPKSIGWQLHLLKHWYGFKGSTGFATLDDSYSGAANGGKEAYIIVQIYQRPYWATGTHAGEYVTDWTPINDPIKKSLNETIANGWEQAGGGANGQWQLHIMANTNTAAYGYMENEDGVYELVYFDYKILEVGMEPGSDGSTFRSYYDGYPNEPKKHSDDPNYYSSKYNEQIVYNYETGTLKLIKDWKLQTDNKANKIFFTVVDDSGRDIAREVYESDNKTYYGIKEDQVTYIKDLDKYVFVLDTSTKTDNTDNHWELMINGLDIVKGFVYKTDDDGKLIYDNKGNPIPETDNTGKIKTTGEVTYEVEEIGAELKDGTITSVTDSSYPYNASYYRKVRLNDEQYQGSTASSEDRLVAGGLQLDSTRANKEDGSLTSARVVNSDEPTTQLTVEKKWPGNKYPSESVKVVLNLQQRRQATDANNVPLWDDGTENGTTTYSEGLAPKWNGDWQAAEGTNRTSVVLPMEGYSGANAWTYTWKGLPTHKVTGNSGTKDEQYDILWYRAIETSSPDWTSQSLKFSGGNNVVAEGANAGGTGDKQHTINEELTNNIDKTDLHIEKTWTNKYADEDSQSGSWGTDKSIKWPDGYAIDYKVVRHAKVVSATEGESTTESFAEDPTRDETAATTYEQKHVNYTDGIKIDDWEEDSFMTGQLSASNPTYDMTGLPKGAVVTTDDNPPSQLAKNTTYVVEYVYEVIETSITTPYGTYALNMPVDTTESRDAEGKYIKEDGVIQTNAPISNDLTNIEVEKKWKIVDESGNVTGDYTPTEGESVTVQLYKSKERPAGAIPVTKGKIQIYVDPMTGEKRDDMANGTITVTVTGDNGVSKDYTLTGPSYSIEADDLDDIAAATGSEIVYTVTVKSVDGSVIESATVNGDGTATVGDIVSLTAKTVDPPAMFNLTFKATTWIERDNWDKAASEPSDNDAYITATVTGGGQTYTYTLNKQNHWGADVSETLPVKDSSGNTISYKVQLKNGKSIYQIRQLNNDNGWDNNSTYYSGSKDQTVTVEYRPVKEKEQSQGGGQQGGNSDEKITISITPTVFKDSLDNKFDSNPTEGSITMVVRNAWSQEVKRITLNSENDWSANIELPKTDPTTNSSSYSYEFSSDQYTINNGNGNFNGSSTINYSAKSKTAINKLTNVYFTIVKTDSTFDGWQLTCGNWTKNESNYAFNGGPQLSKDVLAVSYSSVPVQKEDKSLEYEANTHWDWFNANGKSFSWVAYSGTSEVIKSGTGYPISFTATEKNVYIDITVGNGDTDGTTVSKTDAISSGKSNAPSSRSLKAISKKVAALAVTRSVTIIGKNDLTPIDAVAVGDPVVLTGTNWTQEWDNLPKVDENGDPIYYYVREFDAKVSPDTTYVDTTYEYDLHDNTDAREGYGKITVTNKVKRDVPETEEFKVQKRWMTNGSQWNATYGQDQTIYFKIYKVHTVDGEVTERVQVDTEGNEISSGDAYTLQYSDTVDIAEDKLGGDEDYVKKNFTKNNDNTYTIPFMKSFTMKKLAAGWNYVFVECDSSSTHNELRGSNGNQASDQYWTCPEFEGTTFALKNNLENVTAAKTWSGIIDGKHPAVTFKLYRTEVDILESDTTANGELAKRMEAAKKLSENNPKKAEIFESNGNLKDGYTYMGATYDKTIQANSTTTEVTWEDLPSVNLANGKKYVYIVVEDTTGFTNYEYDGVQVNDNRWGFTNKLKTVEIEVEKKWENNYIPTGATATLTLKSGNTEISSITLNGKSDWPTTEPDHTDWGNDWERVENYNANAHESGAWHASWYNLPKYDDSGKEIVYTVVETAVTPAGFSPDYGVVKDEDDEDQIATSVVLAPNEDNADKKEGSLTNIKRINLDLEKVDKNNANKKLPGATFELIKIQDEITIPQDRSFEKQTVTTAAKPAEGSESSAPAEGTAKFTNLVPGGYYQLKETNAPAGYVITDNEETYFKVTSDGTILVITKDSNKKPSDWAVKSTNMSDMVHLSNTTLTVKNEPGKELPHTGGIGTTIFYILGSVLLLGGAVILISRRRAANL